MSVGVILGQVWGYALWVASGAISVYIDIILWFSEREYVYPACGPLAYYTYIWGFFVYWGVAVVIYSMLRLAGVTIKSKNIPVQTQFHAYQTVSSLNPSPTIIRNLS